MKHTLLTFALLLALNLFSFGQEFSITASDRQHLSLHFELGDFSLDTISRNGELMHVIRTKAIVAPNDYGQPDLPTFNRFIALPQGARAVVEFSTRGAEHISGINIAPSIGSQCEQQPELPFVKDTRTYATNDFYPLEIVQTAEPQKMRGVDVIHLGLSPFQYNPVTQELAFHREMDIIIRFEGGNGHFGDDRLRSPYWDPILRNNILNHDCLEPIDYDARMQRWSQTRPTGCEYLILTPNNDAFLDAAQQLATYRTHQGILTMVKSIGETGATNIAEIKQWFRDIYNQWDIPPAAVCILGDHGDNLQQYIPAYYMHHPIEDFVNTDNPYADMDDDYLPDVCFSRLVAQNESELSLFISKQIEYEYTNPQTDPFFYSHPLTAGAWQTSLWFQICIATISGYLTQQGKQPVRINEIYGGELSESWSSANNTNALVNYFGPNGLGYIPATPGELGGWTGGNAEQVIHAINSGTYLIQHRDHGWTHKWYQPEIYVSDFDGINNPGKMTFLLSVNCKTGQFDHTSNCFTEGLLRMTRDGQNAGIVGAVSPSGRTYSFANDIYLWGLWDLFDPQFLPEYGPYATHVAQWLPAFANVSGKYFLEQTVFPNTDQTMRQTTYNAYHAHCDAFLRIFTEVPQPIEVTHDPSLFSYLPFSITAPEGSQIAITTTNGGHLHIVATATGTGEEQTLTVMENITMSSVHLTITGLNMLRYEEDIPVSVQDGAFVIVDDIALNGGESVLHYNQTVSTDITLTNIGSDASPNGTVSLTSSSPYIDIVDEEVAFATLQPNESRTITDALHFGLTDAIPDGTQVTFTLTTHHGNIAVPRTYHINVLSPNIEAELIGIDDSAGNHNGHLDAGEFASLTFRVTNIGHYMAQHPEIGLINPAGCVRIITPPTAVGNLEIGASVELTYDIFVEFIAGESNQVDFTLRSAINGLQIDRYFTCPLGFTMESFENGAFDPQYWTNDAEHPWRIVFSNTPHGSLCATSDTITHDESSTLSLSFTSTESGFISFYATVSSENNYDFLVFSIDGEEKDRWSGEQDWYQYTYLVSAGEHTYTWAYIKDYSVSNGMDRAMIDYITLPPCLDAVAEQGNAPFEVHPNPTKGLVTITGKGLRQAEVFNTLGQRVTTVQGKGETLQFDISRLPAGVYFVSITDEEGRKCTRKVVKE